MAPHEPVTLQETVAASAAAMTPAELAAALNVSSSTIRRWVAAGDLEATRVGHRLRIEPEAVAQVIKRTGPVDS